MSFAYVKIEELVVGLLEVHDDRKPTLRARLRLFRRMGFPPGVNLGSRGRSSYGADSVIAVVTAFALIDARVPQEFVPALIVDNWASIRTAADRIIDAGRSEPPRMYIAVEFNALAHFQAGDDEDGAGLDGKRTTLQVFEEHELTERLRAGLERRPPGGLTLVDFTALVHFMADAVVPLGMTEAELRKAT